MKKIKLLLLVCSSLIACSFLNSQTLTEGPEALVVKGVGYQKLIGSDDTGFYVFKQSSVGKGIHIIIEKFDKTNFSQIFSKETKVAEIQESMNFTPVTQIQTFMSNDKIFVFFESHNHKEDKLIFFLQTVSLTGELSEVYEVSSTYFKAKNIAIALMGRMFFNVAFSPSGKSFVTIALYGEKEDSENLVCKIYDATSLKKIAERIIPSKDQGIPVFTGNYTVDDNNNLFFSVKYQSAKKNAIGGFAIGLIENASPTVKILPITIPDKKVFHNFAFKSLANGDILIAGIISDTLEKGVDSTFLPASYFIKRIANNSLQTKYEQLKDFKLETKVSLGKAMKTTTFKYTEIIEMNNEIYIITQRTEVRYGRSNGDIANWPTETYTDKEIIVSKFDVNGGVEWTKVIPKFHIGGSLIKINNPRPPRYSGNYKVFVADNKLNFVFSDHPNNKDLAPENFIANVVKPIHTAGMSCESVHPKDKANAVCVSMDSNGKSSKKVFLENVEGGVNYIALGNTVMLSPKKLLIFLENRKTKVEKFATLNF